MSLWITMTLNSSWIIEETSLNFTLFNRSISLTIHKRYYLRYCRSIPMNRCRNRIKLKRVLRNHSIDLPRRINIW
uniref:Uncharacterized protein n=3 Tax=Cycas TaxID=3395 RepID=A6H5H3_CYCTA|nr:hypothetical protein CYtaCp031 [Cycas taitungensis]YP_007474657.1 hypothetical_protein [Cycas revoluta]YP_009308227.1 hypothetical protein [Cycas panzhihuaensis]AEX99206.1 hypothetical_protein [Cycas revoluta]AOS53176.1 hypothetical protein [Cycas panzhihuaensis]BAF64939.1 hypothetical protein [Cycas taitungensis]